VQDTTEFDKRARLVAPSLHNGACPSTVFNETGAIPVHDNDADQRIIRGIWFHSITLLSISQSGESAGLRMPTKHDSSGILALVAEFVQLGNPRKSRQPSVISRSFYADDLRGEMCGFSIPCKIHISNASAELLENFSDCRNSPFPLDQIRLKEFCLDVPIR
jgi:hypothetical protein